MLGIARLTDRTRSKTFLYFSDKLPTRIQFDPKLFNIHPTWIFRGWFLACTNISHGNLIIHCSSHWNRIRFDTSQNQANKDFYTLGIARLTNRIRSKIFLYCSDEFPKRIQFGPKLFKSHPTLIFRGWVVD